MREYLLDDEEENYEPIKTQVINSNYFTTNHMRDVQKSAEFNNQ